jgi:hypothetical protein
MPLYSILDSENYITHCIMSDTCPPNGTPLLNTQFVKPRLVGGVLIETHTPTAEELIAEEFLKYQQRERDGMDAYLKISAEFRVAKISGQISEAEHKAIEELLIPVRDEIRAGQWISGLIKLEALGAQNIGVTLYDRLHLQISNYIAQCY